MQQGGAAIDPSAGGRATEVRAWQVDALVFEVAGERFALPLAQVNEVVRAVALRPLPKAPDVIEGIFDLRGELVPVLDLRARFGLAAKPVELGDHLVVAQAGARRVALRVDQAHALSRLAAVRADDAAHLPRDLGYVAGVASTSDGLVLIHDLESFLSEAEQLQLKRALEGEPADEGPSAS